MKQKKTWLSLCLAAVLLCCVTLVGLEAQAATVRSGTCGVNGGANLTWVLDDSGTLTISGTGEMADDTSSPWYDDNAEIYSIVIEEGTTNIGEGVFYGFYNLTSVSIPDTVTSIGSSAFYGCENLENITIPNSVELIGGGAFSGTGLTTIHIPKNVSYIGDRAFDSDALVSYTVDAENQYYSAADGLLYNKDGSVLVKVPCGLQNVTIPEGVKEIGAYAFSNCQLEELSLPEGVEQISANAFEDASLGKLVLPESLTYIGEYAFLHCNLAELVLPDSPIILEIGAFCDWMSLEKLTFPVSITEIPSQLFLTYDREYDYRYNRLQINFLGDAPAFGEDALLGINALVVVPAENTTWDEAVKQNYGGEIIWKTTSEVVGGCGVDGNILWVLDENGVLTLSGIGDMWDYYPSESPAPWDNCTETDGGFAIQEVVIQEGITSIGSHAFCSQGMLKKVTIPDSVTRIGSSAFWNCSSWIGDTPSGLTEIIIPDSVEHIGSMTFSGTQLTTVHIPKNVSYIGDRAFDSDDLVSFTVDAENQYYSAVDGLLYNKDGTVLVKVPCGLQSVTVPEGVKEIGAYAFSDCNFEELILPESLTYIADSAFFLCQLSEFEVPASCPTLETCAFADWLGLEKITFPVGVTEIPSQLFFGCMNLQEITFLGDAPIFAEDSFMDVVAQVVVPNRNDTWTEEIKQNYGGSITWSTFDEDPSNSGVDGNISWVLDENGVLTISGTGAMKDYALGEAPWGKGLDVGVYGWDIKRVVIQDGVTSIGSYAFCNQLSLEQVTIPASVTQIGDSAFAGCDNLIVRCYLGIEEQWAEIQVGERNQWLTEILSHQAPENTCNTKAPCVYCGTMITARTAEHTLEIVAKIPATCTETGILRHFKCTTCNEEFYDNKGNLPFKIEDATIAAKGHTEEILPAKAPTCTDSGLTEGKKCSVCSEILAAQETIAAKGHVKEDIPAKEPTCTEHGYGASSKCSRCGEILVKQEQIPAKGHVKEDIPGKAPTCTEPGYSASQKCTHCGEVLVKQEELPAKGHTLTAVPEKSATYEASGNLAYWICICEKWFSDVEGVHEIMDKLSVELAKLIKVEVTETVVKDAIEEAVTSETVVIPLPEEKKDDEAVGSVQIPVVSVGAVVEADKTLTVETTQATVVFDKTAQETIVEKADDAAVITIEIIKVAEDDLKKEQKESIQEEKVELVISAQVICNEEKISNFNGGKATVYIPFQVPEGQKGSDFKVVYIADDGTVEDVPTVYEDGKLVVELEHFSEYAVINTAVASEPGAEPETGDHSNMVLWMTLCLTAMAAMLMMVFKRKAA